MAYLDNDKSLDVRGSRREKLVVELDLNIGPQNIDEDAEVRLLVNGRVVKRMNAWQARRLGIAF